MTKNPAISFFFNKVLQIRNTRTFYLSYPLLLQPAGILVYAAQYDTDDYPKNKKC